MPTSTWLAPAELIPQLSPDSWDEPRPADDSFAGTSFSDSRFNAAPLAGDASATEPLVRLFERLGRCRTGDRPAANLACWGPSGIWNARKWHRIPWPVRLTLVGLDDDTGAAAGEPIEVAGRELSLGGLSFQHDRPLAFRRVLLRYEDAAAGLFHFVTALRWCRFTRGGRYQSGGPFVSVRNGWRE